MADPNALLVKLGEEFKSLQGRIGETLEKQDAEIKKHGGSLSLTTAELKKFTDQHERVIADLQGELKANSEKHAAEMKAIQDRADAMEAKFTRAPFEIGEEEKSPGQAFVESQEYKLWNPRTGGYMSSQVAGAQMKSAPFVQSKAQRRLRQMKDLGNITGHTALRGVLSTELQTMIVGAPRRTSHIRDYMNVIRTDKAAMRWVRETGYTNNASPRGEGESANLSEIQFDEETASAKTVAAGLVITREMAADAPTLMQWIDGRLRQGVEDKEDADLIDADGNSNNIIGVKHVDGVQNFVRGGPINGKTATKIDNLRQAQTQLRLIEGKTANGNLGLVNPVDAEEMDLLCDTEERYIWVNVETGGGQQTFWRMPIIDHNEIDQGEFVVGDWQQGVTLYDLEEAFVEIFNQHADFALKGKLLLMGSERIYVCWQVPELFVAGNFGMVGSGS